MKPLSYQLTKFGGKPEPCYWRDYVLGEPMNKGQIQISVEELIRARLLLRKNHFEDISEANKGVNTYIFEDGTSVDCVMSQRKSNYRPYVLRIDARNEENFRVAAKRLGLLR